MPDFSTSQTVAYGAGLVGGLNLLTSSAMDYSIIELAGSGNTSLAATILGIGALFALLDMAGVLDVDDMADNVGSGD